MSGESVVIVARGNMNARKVSGPAGVFDFYGSGGGIRTPDTWIMIPLL